MTGMSYTSRVKVPRRGSCVQLHSDLQKAHQDTEDERNKHRKSNERGTDSGYTYDVQKDGSKKLNAVDSTLLGCPGSIIRI